MTYLRRLPSLLMCLCLLCMLAACNQYNKKRAEEIADKYHEKSRLNRDEYKEAVDMCIPVLEALPKDVNKLYESANDQEEFEDGMKELQEKYDEKYEFMEDLFRILNNADEDEMGSATYKKWNKAQKQFEKDLERLYEKADRKFNKE